MTRIADQQTYLVEIALRTQSRLQSIFDVKLPHQGIESQVIWRIKSAASIQRKIAYRKETDRPDDFINDLLGFRVIVSHLGLIHVAVEVLRNWLIDERQFRLMEMRDYFNNPRSPFYRSVHIDVLLDQPDDKNRRQVGVEFQVTTYMQNYLAAIGHDLRYGKQRAENSVEKRLLDEIWSNVEQVDTAVAAAFSNQ